MSTTTAPILTRTQSAALAELRRVGHMWPQSRGRYAVSGTGHRDFSRGTLDALVAAGLAEWARGESLHHPNGAPGVLPYVQLVTESADDNTMSERECVECGDETLVLSSRDWCDSCEETGAHLRTRYLVVALPNASGDEADSVAEAIETEVLTDGFTSHGTATHALGETLPVGMSIMPHEGGGIVVRDAGQRTPQYLNLDVVGARALAGALLIAAGNVEARQAATA